MSSKPLSLTEGFAEPSLDAWRASATKTAPDSRFEALVRRTLDGIEVQPRWPGGNAQVMVDLGAQRAQPGTRAWQGNRPTAVEQWSLVSTVQAPLGEWIDVAQVQSAARGTSVSTGGFSASTASRQRSLQLRVSLP